MYSSAPNSLWNSSNVFDATQATSSASYWPSVSSPAVSNPHEIRPPPGFGHAANRTDQRTLQQELLLRAHYQQQVCFNFEIFFVFASRLEESSSALSQIANFIQKNPEFKSKIMFVSFFSFRSRYRSKRTNSNNNSSSKIKLLKLIQCSTIYSVRSAPFGPTTQQPMIPTKRQNDDDVRCVRCIQSVILMLM